MTWEHGFTIANGLSAVAVAIFAWLQWVLTRRHEEGRRRERAEDEQQRWDAAYATVHAEWFRIWAIATQWGKGDLIELIEADQFWPEEMLPRDWGTTARELGQLGFLTAKLGSFGLALAHDVARAAHRLQLDVGVFSTELPEGPRERQQYRSKHGQELRRREAQLKKDALEAANVLQDALEHAPNANLTRTVAFNTSLHSEHARRLAKATEHRSAAALPDSLESWKIVVRED